MRFFKANQPPRSPADEAAAVRLMAIASRGKASSSPEWATEPAIESQDEPPPPEVLQ